MDSADFEAAGERVFNRLTPPEKDRISQFLSSSLSTGAAPWAATLQQTIEGVLARRTREGQSLDAADVTDEVMPLAIAAVPIDVRRELFAMMRTMLTETAR